VTREAAIDCVIELLDEQGEQGLRIAEVTERSGISVGSIYHHFGDRDGLIKAARAKQFCASPSTYGILVAELVSTSRTAREFADGLRKLNLEAFSRDRDHERLQRAEYIGSAVSRPDLLAELRDHQTQMITIATEISQTLIDRGWLRDGVTAHAFATFNLAMEFGSVVLALDARRVADDEWSDTVQRAIESLLRIEPLGTLG
jgi:AcrR family transcriptional regulator